MDDIELDLCGVKEMENKSFGKTEWTSITWETKDRLKGL